MRKKTRQRISTSVLVIMIAAIFLCWEPQPLSAQDEGFKSYQLLVFCGSSSLTAATFWHDVSDDGNVGRPLMGLKTVCAGKKCGDGPVTLANALAQFPRGVATSIQTQVDKYQANLPTGEDWFLTCLSGGKKPLPPKCKGRSERDGDLPWFDPGATGCTDWQATGLTTSFASGKCSFTLRACGRIVLRDTIDAPNSASCTREYRTEHYGGVAPLPQKACCDSFREAASAGSGCNPETDADCDGIPNEKDGFLQIQDPYYAPQPGQPNKDFNPADFDPRPPGLDWEELMPSEPCKQCQWVATGGKLACSPDGVKEHEYKATWECPTSGIKKVVTKRVAAKFPCTPPKRSTPSAPTSRPTPL